MNAVLLILLAASQPGADSPPGQVCPRAAPYYSGAQSQGHVGFGGWLRGRRHHKHTTYRGNGNGQPVTGTQTSSPVQAAPVVESASPEPPLAEPSPAVGAEEAPRRMPRGEPLTTSTAPPQD
jgi:hypothetical protein